MTAPQRLPGRRIGFVSTRLAGTDGVSLETEKWATVLERQGHICCYFAGECDRPAERSRIVPEAHFRHPAIAAIGNAAFDSDLSAPDLEIFSNPKLAGLPRAVHHRVRPPALSARIRELALYLEAQLYQFIHDFELELLIIENALAIPMNLPLGIALTEFIAETGLPIIAHHHDFAWERQRFTVNCVDDLLRLAFPPALPTIRHVVINSVAAAELSRRVAVTPFIIPNVMDFDHLPSPPDAYTQHLRADLGLLPGEYFILQPTRIVQRKGIEHAIELVKRLGLPARLVISHASGDEGSGYERHLRSFAALLDVPVSFVSGLIGDQRGLTPAGRPVYALADLYPHADLVTYPSALEGFGNAFLEAVYYRRPLVVNNYSIFEVDIKPKGFQVIEFDGYIAEETLQQTRRLFTTPSLAAEMADTNYNLARRHYSYSMLDRRLQTLVADLFGEQTL
ncbi:MAG: glycosyltransferase family 4 protein [Anaerolineales bacterium]|nr:glycosyltransferase family 4 protein [Anaerolineales bacterium]